MSTEIRVYDQAPGDPVVVMVTSGTFDVSRLALLMHKGRCEDSARADYIRRNLERHRGGRAALKLLRDHGGPDLLEDVTADDRERGELRAEVAKLRAELAAERMSHAWTVPKIPHDATAPVGPWITRTGWIGRSAGTSDVDHTRYYAAQLLAAADEAERRAKATSDQPAPSDGPALPATP